MKNVFRELNQTIEAPDLFDTNRVENLISVSIVRRKPNDGDTVIRTATAQVAGNVPITKTAEAAIRLSKTLQDAPVQFNFGGFVLILTSSHTIEDVVDHLQELLKDDRRAGQMQIASSIRRLAQHKNRGRKIQASASEGAGNPDRPAAPKIAKRPPGKEPRS